MLPIHLSTYLLSLPGNIITRGNDLLWASEKGLSLFATVVSLSDFIHNLT